MRAPLVLCLAVGTACRPALEFCNAREQCGGGQDCINGSCRPVPDGGVASSGDAGVPDGGAADEDSGVVDGGTAGDAGADAGGTDAGLPRSDAGIVDGGDAPEQDAGGCGGHDEDADLVPDACDVCPADADPQQGDGDGDGVGDACDPSPAQPGDVIALFDPFTGDSGAFVASGELEFHDDGLLATDVNAVGTLRSLGLSLQDAVIDTLVGVESQSGVGFSNVAILARANGNEGVLCMMGATDNDDATLTAGALAGGGGAVVGASTPLGGTLTGSSRRLRMRLQGGDVTCERRPGGPAVTDEAASEFAGELGLRAARVAARFEFIVVYTRP